MRRFYGVSIDKNGAPRGTYGPIDPDGMVTLLAAWRGDQRDNSVVMVVTEAVAYDDQPQLLANIQVFDKRDRDPTIGEEIVWTNRS